MSRSRHSEYRRTLSRPLICMVAGAAFFHGAMAAKAAETISITVDQAKVIELPERTATIIIGNPIVADVTMLKKTGRMVLTGKSFGSTNLIALDARGDSIGESVIRVTASAKGLLVQRGADRETYDCSPRCLPTVNLADSGKFLGETSGQVKQYGSMAGGK
jgi:Flp pilus assembly secretin CpaC